MSASATHPALRSAARPAILALCAGLAVLVVIFLPECRAAVRVWNESTAYGHCYLIVPIAAYLAWDQRARIAGLPPRPSAAFLLLGVPLALFWFASERIGVMEFRQFAALGFVELLFLTVLGWRLFRVMLAPFLYLIFLVPFGAFVTPVLQTFTAKFIDVGLTILGIPHYVSDMVIEISAGTFFVAEACAGLRFLIASFAFGVFYSLLNFQSYKRRVAFICASIIVPVVANGFRALGIVVLGDIIGSAEAAAADHIIYGWVFFSVVMLLLVVAGMPLREAAPTVRKKPERHGLSRARSPWPVGGVLFLAAVAPVTARTLAGNAIQMAVSGLPKLVAPQGCVEVAFTGRPDGSTSKILCGSRLWEITIQALPPRSTASAVTEARTLQLGSLDPEETVNEKLTGVPASAGVWQGFISRDPPAVAAVSVWVRGAPAAGGLSQRLAQAIDSLKGSSRPPVVISIVRRGVKYTSEAETRSELAEVTRIAARQTDLTTMITKLSISSPATAPSPLGTLRQLL